jgi:ABC-type uncharacterized transport system substrate-binding protein
MSYGESLKEFYRGDLPIEQVGSQLVINRKTAAALGVTVPPVVYVFADEVIE